MTSAAPKKSLFKRPKWAATPTSAEPSLIVDDSPPTAAGASATAPTTIGPQPSLFDRSREFDRIVAEKERRKREKSERKQRKEEKERRRSSGEYGERGGSASASKVKRRRVEDGDGDDEEVKEEQAGGGMVEKEEGTRRSSPLMKQARVETARKGPTVIELLDSSESEDDGALNSTNALEPRGTEDLDEDLPFDSVYGQPMSRQAAPKPQLRRAAEPLPARAPPKPQPPQPPPSDSESDPEIAEIKRNARLKRRREEEAAAATEKARLASNNPYSTTTTTTSSTLPTTTTTTPTDPKIQLFITSPIPGTTPLIVTRKLSQRLQEVHAAWCSKQIQHSLPNFNPDAVFLTFRLRKLYPVTTCRSLGLQIDGQGKIIPDRRDWIDDDETGVGGEHEGKVHLEAVTAELWDELKRARQNGRSKTTGGGNNTNKDDDDAKAEAEAEAAAQEAEPVLRITMKAKGFKDVKLKVKPSTTFAKMVNAARRSFGEQQTGGAAGIGPDKTVTLAFDGEALEPEDGRVGDTEIEDMDSIEVWIK